MKKFNLRLTKNEYEYIKQQTILNHISMVKFIRDLIIESKTIDMGSRWEKWLKKNNLKTESKII